MSIQHLKNMKIFYDTSLCILKLSKLPLTPSQQFKFKYLLDWLEEIELKGIYLSSIPCDPYYISELESLLQDIDKYENDYNEFLSELDDNPIYPLITTLIRTIRQYLTPSEKSNLHLIQSQWETTTLPRKAGINTIELLSINQIKSLIDSLAL